MSTEKTRKMLRKFCLSSRIFHYYLPRTRTLEVFRNLLQINCASCFPLAAGILIKFQMSLVQTTYRYKEYLSFLKRCHHDIGTPLFHSFSHTFRYKSLLTLVRATQLFSRKKEIDEHVPTIDQEPAHY